MKRYAKLHICARILEVLMGVYFLVGALPKGLDIDKFAVQIAAYKVMQSPNLLLATALFTLFVEVALGISMVVGLRLKGLTILAMQGMLVFFAVLILYAWRMYGLEDCGCFPFFKMSPPVSLAKNGVLIASGIFILWVRIKGNRAINKEENSESKSKKENASTVVTVAAKFLVAAILASAATAYAYFDIDWSSFKSTENDTNSISYAQFELYLPEGYFNLGSGLYLVPIMSMTCDECMGMVPEINELWQMPDMPPMVALCYEDVPGKMDTFRGDTQPVFPMYSLGDRAMLYYALIDEDSFRLSLVHDGKLVKAWDGHVPPYEEIMDSIAAVGGE